MAEEEQITQGPTSVYEKASAVFGNMGSEEEFNENIQDLENRKGLFDELSGHYKWKDFEQFESELPLKKKRQYATRLWEWIKAFPI